MCNTESAHCCTDALAISIQFLAQNCVHDAFIMDLHVLVLFFARCVIC